jgi:periplasmic protein TonB
MSLSGFPPRSPHPRATKKASSQPPEDQATRLPNDFNWPLTDDEINLVEVIDLGSMEPMSSAGFVAVVGKTAEPPAPPPRPRLVSSHRTPPRSPRIPTGRRLSLWPLAIGVIAMALVESRSIPQWSPASAPSPPPAVTAVVHAEPPPVQPTAAAPAAPAAPASPVASPRPRGVAPTTARRAVRPARSREPDSAADGFAPPRASARQPTALEPAPLEAAGSRQTNLTDDSFTPPRVSMRRPRALGPSPFPAARGSRTRIEVMVDALGRVESARLRSPGTSYFDERALEAVRGWRFEPARRGGRPVRAALDVEIGSP